MALPVLRHELQGNPRPARFALRSSNATSEQIVAGSSDRTTSPTATNIMSDSSDEMRIV